MPVSRRINFFFFLRSADSYVSVPETILTTGLHPYFETAISVEGASQASNSRDNRPGRLSNDVRQPSRAFILGLTALVNWLPLENRDLLCTVVEIINATSGGKPSESQLSVFNSALKTTPPGLLRVLCEHEEIWKTSLKAVARGVAILRGLEPKNTRARRDTIIGEAPYSDPSPPPQNTVPFPKTPRNSPMNTTPLPEITTAAE